jgi:adenosylmethionine-8-amino-7-oxononanoate aminotransferase
VANANLDLLLTEDWCSKIHNLEKRLKAGLETARSLPHVADVRVLGGIGVVEMHKPVDVERLQAFFVEQGVWIRPFGRLIYVMPPYIMGDEDLDKICKTMLAAAQLS